MANYIDNFSGTAGFDLRGHVSDTGQTWGGLAGSWLLDGVGGVYLGIGNGVYPSSVTPASPDYDVTATFNQVTASQFAGIAARYDSGTGNYYYVFVGSGNVLTLRAFVGGSNVNIGSTFTVTGSLNANPITLRCVGTTISVIINGTTVITGTNSSITAAGQAGVYGFTGVTATTGYHLQAFSVKDAGSPTLIANTPILANNEGTTLVLQAPSVGGTSSISYQWFRAPDVSGSPGSYVSLGTTSSTTRWTDTGLSASTKYYYKYTATDSSGTPQVVTSAPFSITTNAPGPMFSATFANAPSSYPLVGGYISETGDTFSPRVGFSGTSQGVINSGILSGVSVENQFVASRSLPQDTPVDVIFTVTGTITTTEKFAFGTRFNPTDGSGILGSLNFTGNTGSALVGEFLSNGNFSSFVGTSNSVAPVLTNGIYRTRFHAVGSLIKIGLFRASDSTWYNGTSWQSAHYDWLVAYISDTTMLRAGSAFLDVSPASANLVINSIASAMSAPTLGVGGVDYNFVRLIPRRSFGANGAITYTLQRASGGAYSTIATIPASQMDQTFTDFTVASSTTYTYQLIATDSTGYSVTSSVATATTLATGSSQTVPAGHTPSTPITAYSSNTLQVDTQTSPLQLHGPSFWWDDAISLCLAVGEQFASGNNNAIVLYTSKDYLNWENRSIVASTTINSVASSGLDRWKYPRIARNPTTGRYFLFVTLWNSTTPANSVLGIFSSATALGPYNTTEYTGQPGTGQVFDMGFLLDDDGTALLYSGSSVFTLSSDWKSVASVSAIATATSTPVPNFYGRAMLRRGGLYYMIADPNSGYTYDANVAYMAGIRTGPFYPCPAPFATSGSNTAATSYNSRASSLFLTRGGNTVYAADDLLLGQTSPNGGGPQSGNVFLPVTFDNGSNPTIPYASQFTPTAQPTSSITISGPQSILQNVAATFTATLDNPAPTGGISFTPSVSGFTATFGTSPIVIASGATSGTFTVTATSVASGLVGGSAPGLSVAAESVNATNPATAFTMSGPATGSVGHATGNFTVTPNGVISGAKVVTVKDDLNNTIATLNFADGSGSAQTFNFNPVTGQVGSRTLTATSSPTLGTAPTAAIIVYNLVIAPTSSSGANGAVINLTATLTGGSGSLAATTTAGTLSTAAPTSGTAFSITLPGSGSGSAVVTVTGPGGTSVTSTINYAPVGTLVAGTATFFSSGPFAITISASEATGGSGTINHQWQRNTNDGAFANVTASGSTGLTISDNTAVAGNKYGYRLTYTDTESTPQTATSNVIYAQIYTGGPISSGGLINLIGGSLFS